MDKRPLFTVGAAFFCGVFAAGLRPWRLTYAVLFGIAACCAIYLAIMIITHKKLSRAAILTAFICAILPAVGYRYCAEVWQNRADQLAGVDGKEVSVLLKISSPAEHRGESLRAEAVIIELYSDGERWDLGTVNNKILLTVAKIMPYTHTALSYGNILEARGKIYKPAPQQNEFLFDYQRYLYSRGLCATMYTDSGRVKLISSAGAIFPIGTGIFVRDCIVEIFNKLLPEKEAALVSAVFIGKTDEIDDITYNNFSAAGLIHLMAVSGLHVVMIAKTFEVVSRRAGKNVSTLISAAAVILFIFITGFSASVVRAVITFTLYTSAKFVGKSFDSLSSIAAASTIILLYNPMQAFALGFQLSFSAAISILVLAKLIKIPFDKLKLPKFIKEPLSVSLAVNFGIFPIIAASFNEFATYSPLANIAAAPLIFCLLVSAQLTAFIGALCALFTALRGFLTVPVAFLTAPIEYMAAPFEYMALLPAGAAALIIRLLERIAVSTANLPFSTTRIGAFGPVAFVLYYCVVAALVYIFSKQGLNKGPACASCNEKKNMNYVKPAAALLTIALSLTAYNSVYAAIKHVEAGDGRGYMEVVFLDVGSANAAFINIDNRFNIVVDAGGTTEYYNKGTSPVQTTDNIMGVVAEINNIPGVAAAINKIVVATAEKRLLDYLNGRGVKNIDIAIATHGDTDHINGFWSLIGKIPIKNFVTSYNCGDNLNTLIDYMSEHKTEIIQCTAGDIIYIDDNTKIEVLSPDIEDKGLSMNEMSVVARVVYGNMKAMFCGDINKAVEQKIVWQMLGEQYNSGLSPHGKNNPCHSQLMSVPHHGSKQSSGDVFLSSVKPRIAVCGVGANRYGHPSQEVIERYKNVPADFYRTDIDGMVTVLCDSGGIVKVKCYNDIDNSYAWDVARRRT